MVIVNLQGCLQLIITDLINIHEKNEERKKAITEQIFSMLQTVPLTKIDVKTKEIFGTKFNQLKSFIHSL